MVGAMPRGRRTLPLRCPLEACINLAEGLDRQVTRRFLLREASECWFTGASELEQIAAHRKTTAKRTSECRRALR